MNIYKLLGHRIKQKRKQLDFSQEKLSEICGLSPSYIGLIERGDKRLSVETLIKIANTLKVNTDYLLKDSIEFDSTHYMEDTNSMLSDMDEEEMKYINEMIANTRKLMKKGDLIQNNSTEKSESSKED